MTTDRASLRAERIPGIAGSVRVPHFEARVVRDELVTEGDEDVLLGHQVGEWSGHAGGNWVRWRWQDDTLTVTNDPFGAYPCYYAATDSSIAISPSIDRLLTSGASRELDLDALAAFLAVGYYPGTDTPFRSIRALPPACELTWSKRSLSIASHPTRFVLSDMTRAQASEGVNELFRQAIARRIPDGPADYIMPISGGRDSRHILLELMRQDHPPRMTLTVDHFPFDWGGDVPYAARLAHELGLQHTVVRPDRPVVTEQRKNHLVSYGSPMHAWFVPAADLLTAQTSYTYEGLPGGTVLERHFFSNRVRAKAAAGSWDELAAWMGKKADGQPRYAPLLTTSLRETLGADRATTRIRAEIERHLDKDDPLMSYRFWNRTMRESTLVPNAMMSGIPAVYTPFMDPDFLVFAMSIPPRFIDRAFHDDLLAAAFPQVAHVPYKPERKPRPSRSYLRRLDLDILRLLQHCDGSLVDRSSLMRRAVGGIVRGDDWFTWGRRFSLLTYLVQLEELQNPEPDSAT